MVALKDQVDSGVEDGMQRSVEMGMEPLERGRIRVFIVHGHMVSLTSNWIPWLAAIAGERACGNVVVLPEPASHDPEKWIQALGIAVGVPDASTYYVGHGVGCITILRHIHRHSQSVRVGGALLVSPFNEPLVELPQLDKFASSTLDWRCVSEMFLARTVIALSDDSMIPVHASREFAHLWSAEWVELPVSDDFLETDGFTKFDVASDELIKMLLEAAKPNAISPAA